MNNFEEQETAKTLDQEKARERAKMPEETQEEGLGEAVEAIAKFHEAMRMINLIGSASGVGIFITLFTMNAQAFFGNLMRLPLVPRLGKIEIFALVIVDFLVFVSLLITYLFFSILTMVYTDPLGTLWTFVKEGLGEFWDIIKAGLGV